MHPGCVLWLLGLELRLRITHMGLAGLAHTPEDPHTELHREAV